MGREEELEKRKMARRTNIDLDALIRQGVLAAVPNGYRILDPDRVGWAPESSERLRRYRDALRTLKEAP